MPRSFERSSPSNFQTQGSFIQINSEKIFKCDLFHQIALQNLHKNLGFSETVMWNLSQSFLFKTDSSDTMSLREDFISPSIYFQLLVADNQNAPTKLNKKRKHEGLLALV